MRLSTKFRWKSIVLALVVVLLNFADAADVVDGPYEVVALPLSAGFSTPPAAENFGYFPKEVSSVKQELTVVNENFLENKVTVEAMTEIDVDQYYVKDDKTVYLVDDRSGATWSCDVTLEETQNKEVNSDINKGKKVKLSAKNHKIQADHLLCGDKLSKYEETATKIDVGNVYPRWLKAGEKVQSLHFGFFKDQKLHNADHLLMVPGIDAPGTNLGGRTWQVCNTACTKGKVMKFTMMAGTWTMMIGSKITDKCNSFLICLSPTDFLDQNSIPECGKHNSIQVLTKAGFVSWPNGNRGSALRFTRSSDAWIEIGYGLKDETGKIRGEFTVTNWKRQYITSDTKGFLESDAAKIAIFFPDEQCLHGNIGIFSKNIKDGKTLIAAKVEKPGQLYNKEGDKITEGTDERLTTPAPDIEMEIKATTTPSTFEFYENNAEMTPVGSERLESTLTASSFYVDGKVLVWGYLFGFILGVLVGVLIGGAIFYFLRRTIYGFWYRSMFKRYGCDVSGTTGGVTGIGFGNTTTGAMTVNSSVSGMTGVSGTSTSGGTSTTAGTTVSKGDTLAM